MYSLKIYDVINDGGFNNLNFMSFNNVMEDFLQTIIEKTKINLDNIKSNFE